MMIAIVLAAGRGTRMGANMPKQFLKIDGERMLARTLRVFEKSPSVDSVILVAPEDYALYCRDRIVHRFAFQKVKEIVVGGRERYDSVWNALEACEKWFQGTHGQPTPEEERYVMIHDGARPYVTEEIIHRAAEAVKKDRAVAVGMPSKDTVKIADPDGYVAETPDRRRVWIIQTPQAFSFCLIRKAHQKLREEQRMEGVTDDAMLVEASGLARVKLVEGSYGNIKITTPEDLPGEGEARHNH